MSLGTGGHGHPLTALSTSPEELPSPSLSLLFQFLLGLSDTASLTGWSLNSHVCVHTVPYSRIRNAVPQSLPKNSKEKGGLSPLLYAGARRNLRPQCLENQKSLDFYLFAAYVPIHVYICVYVYVYVLVYAHICMYICVIYF